MKEKYIEKIVNLISNESMTVIIAIYNAICSFLDKK